MALKDKLNTAPPAQSPPPDEPTPIDVPEPRPQADDSQAEAALDAVLDELQPPVADDQPVAVLVSRAMDDVTAIRKASLFQQGGTRYNFRGVDDVVKAMAPVLRRHGLIVMPISIIPNYGSTSTKSGGSATTLNGLVTYAIIGPRGDQIIGQVLAEAFDTSDKSASKFMSVALRIFLLQAFMIPTGDPDPDSVRIERDVPRPRPGALVDEICDPKTPLQRLVQIKRELVDFDMEKVIVQDRNGEDVALARLLWLVGKEREEAAKASE